MVTRVLLVENEALIALDVQDILEEAGYAVVGPASRVSAALALLEQSECDCAALDIQLDGEQVWPLAHALHQRGIPFIFLSGSPVIANDSADWLAQVPYVAKPVNPRELVATLEALVSKCGVTRNS